MNGLRGAGHPSDPESVLALEPAPLDNTKVETIDARLKRAGLSFASNHLQWLKRLLPAYEEYAQDVAPFLFAEITYLEDWIAHNEP